MKTMARAGTKGAETSSHSWAGGCGGKALGAAGITYNTHFGEQFSHRVPTFSFPRGKVPERCPEEDLRMRAKVTAGFSAALLTSQLSVNCCYKDREEAHPPAHSL